MSGAGEVDFTIADNDIGTFTLARTPATLAEDGAATASFALTLDKSNATGTAVTVPYTITGTAANGVDYSVQGTSPMTFPEGIFSQNINIATIGDTGPEPNETIILTLGNPSNATKFSYTQMPVAQRTVTIIDDDCVAGDTPPTINARATGVCSPPTTSVNLNTYVVGAAAGAPTGSSLRWSTTANPTTAAALLPNANVTANGTYHAVYWVDETCFTGSNPVTITFNTPPSAGTLTAPANPLCNNTSTDFGVNSLSLDTVISGQTAGAWTVGSVPGSTTPTIGAGNIVSFEGQAVGDYVFTYTTTGAVTPCVDDIKSVTIEVDDCDKCAAKVAPSLDTSVQRTFCDDITTSLNDYIVGNAQPVPC
ncbi:Calx-beta domain-containing protein [Zobellia nedashkovskayae]